MIGIPITFDSGEFEFVILGPIGLRDGILVHSKELLSMELVSYSYSVYNNLPLEEKRKDFFGTLISYNKFDSNLSHTWSNVIEAYIPTGDVKNISMSQRFEEQREFRLLLCFSTKAGNRRYNESEIGALVDKFEDKAYDFYSILYDNTIDEKLKQSLFVWHFSSLMTDLNE